MPTRTPARPAARRPVVKTPTAAPASVAVNGPKLRELRQLAGLNLAGLASAASISDSYVSAIEHGHRKRVSPAVFGRVCNALGLRELTERRELVRAA